MNLLSKETRLKFEDVTFDIQCFISEHAQFLSPAQSSYLLKFLTSTQRTFRDQTEKLTTQRSALDARLDAKEKENQEEVSLRNDQFAKEVKRTVKHYIGTECSDLHHDLNSIFKEIYPHFLLVEKVPVKHSSSTIAKD